ncbi:hypothetical protein [Nocardioides sp.]|uniref:hypothetical protein n=1 Tax=Nocardioides sp. TaxID=35761 RepID=UPI0027347539|nr:hypothetical protein [Nocardioides sp.]MDP3892243.1 hypothetical protein [Nocardioides sp.]
MSMDPSEEYERVLKQYAPVGSRDMVLFGSLIGAFGVASMLGWVSWSFVIGGTIWMVAGEVTEWRVRRNAREFAEASR